MAEAPSFEVDQFTEAVEKNLKPETSRRIREILSDAYAFIRSAESNAALATVTLEELMGDQIKRNGETAQSNAAQYNPYSFEPGKELPAGLNPTERANFLGASDTQRPTKLDQILAIQNEMNGVIEEIKQKEPVDVADAKDYSDSNQVSAPQD